MDPFGSSVFLLMEAKKEGIWKMSCVYAALRLDIVEQSHIDFHFTSRWVNGDFTSFYMMRPLSHIIHTLSFDWMKVKTSRYRATE